MKVLTITNMWPHSRKKFYGIFVKEQVDALTHYYPDLDNKLWFIRGYIGKFNYVFSIFQLNWHLLFHSYDIIHIHSALSGIFLLFAPLRKNVIITLHGTEILDSSQYKVSKRVIKKAIHLICVSNEIEHIVKEENPNAMTYTVPCAVRDDFFVDNRVKKDTVIRIVFPSAKWREVKNYPLFFEIISRLRLVCSNEIQTIELDNKTREEILVDLNEADVLLMTSFHEGSPQIIKEAMCCNTPIVSSNVGTVQYMLNGLIHCAVINGYESLDYVNAIQQILQSFVPGLPIRSNGRERIYELKYDEKSIATQIRHIYNEVVSS
jgi:glycosyltransferase involved in cell wall biosynthesis